MRKLSCVIAVLALPLLVLADDTPKPEKKPIQAFTDPAQAGPDFAIQGEYLGSHAGATFGGQVIAEGDGKFHIKSFVGGLPGEGWDGDARNVKEWSGELKDGRVEFGDNEAKCVIAEGKITVTVGAESFMLEKVTRKSPTAGAKPPEGAIVLFDGKNLDGWTKMDRKSSPSWELVEGGAMQVKGGDIISKEKFARPHTIHVEFRLPFMPRARGQGRANSGVYVQNHYEVQVLDSFGLKGLDNEAGGIYSQIAPKVNMCYPPLQWQTYDIDFTPAKFEDGKKVANARATVKHNGVLIHDNVELKGPTPGGVAESDSADGVRLQDHGNPMQFRNIWVVEKK